MMTVVTRDLATFVESRDEDVRDCIRGRRSADRDSGHGMRFTT